MSRQIIFQLARLLKERAESLIKYISSMPDFIKNQLRHGKKGITSRSGEKYGVGAKLREIRNDSTKGEQIAENIVIWSDDQQRIPNKRYIVKKIDNKNDDAVGGMII